MGKPTTLSYHSPVVSPDLLSELRALCQALKLALREETLNIPGQHGAGGLVTLRGRPTVFLDLSAPEVEKIAVLADALCSFDLRGLAPSSEALRALTLARCRRRRQRRIHRGLRMLPAPVLLASRWRRNKPGLRRCADPNKKPKDS